MRIFDKLQEKGDRKKSDKFTGKFNHVKKYWNKNRIYMRLLVVIMFFSVAPCLLIGIWANYYIKNVVLDNYMEEYLDSVYKSIQDGMNHYIDQISAYSVYIFSGGEIYQAADSKKLTRQEKTERIRRYLNSNWNSIDLAANVDIVIDSDFVIRKKDENIKMPEENYKEPLRHTNILLLNCLAEGENGEKYLVFGRTVYNMASNKREFDLYIYVPEEEIYKVLSEVNNENNLLYLTANDRVISHPDKTKLGNYVIFPDATVFGKPDITRRIGEYFYDYRTMNFKIATCGKWAVESRMSYKELYRTTDRLQSETMIILCFAIFAALILAIIVPISLLRSISTLKNRMHEFVTSETENRTPQFSYEEIYDLEESFNRMIVEINELMQRNVMEKEKQRRAELQALQAQINPHFIYNALDAIAWYAKIEKQTYIADMVCELATFFRISLHKGDNIIKIHEEISHVESYIAIEQLRFPGMFDVYYKIQEDLMEEKMIKIILQPIVENSIKHGFENIDSGGIINITAYRDGDDIIFEVEDNGHGMNFDPLAAENAGSVGYGIKNVNERIKLEYGERYGLKYQSVPGEGTTVKIRIGKIENPPAQINLQE